MNEHADGTGVEKRGGFPAEVTREQYQTALERARAYLRSALEMRERARVSEEVASARMRSAERTLRIARQVLARLQMLGRRFDTN
jgi:multidrug resistance efflux pump